MAKEQKKGHKTTHPFNKHPKKKAMIEALEVSLGVITSACDKVGITRRTHYTWLKEDEEYKDACDDIVNAAKDFVETKMFEQIKRGNAYLIMNYLKTKCKDRGYVERQEITGADGGPVKSVNISKKDIKEALKENDC